MKRSTTAIEKRIVALEAKVPATAEERDISPAEVAHWIANELRGVGGVTFDREQDRFVVIGHWKEPDYKRLARSLNRARADHPDLLIFPAFEAEVDYTLGEIDAGRLRVQLVPSARLINTLGWDCDQSIVYPVQRAVTMALDQVSEDFPRDLAEYAALLRQLRPFCFDILAVEA